MSDATLVNIARLMTTYNFEIEQLPDDLKCAQCKLVLKDACQLPCCCRYCRACIDDIIGKGGEFCPGRLEECGESLLSRFAPQYEANKRVLRLTVKCPHDGCVHECQLASMEEHLRECQRKSEDCPFRELGCTQDKLAADEMGGHLHHENRRHIEILIEVIANINREIEMLKQKDEASSREIEMLKQKDEASSREIETMKHELTLKDEQIRSIKDQLIHVQNENKSIKNDVKSIKEEKEDLAGRVRILSEEIERETAERRENNELDSARVIDHVDREIAAVTRLIESKKDELTSQIQLVRGDFGPKNRDIQSIKDDICSAKSQVQTIQAPVGLGQFDACFEWQIDNDVDNTGWFPSERLSEYFYGEVHPYKYRLRSVNYYFIGTPSTALCIHLHIYAGPNDGQLAWPFEARVVITVTDRDRHEACRSISLQCRIERPPDNQFRGSVAFKFLNSELKKAGLNLSRGVRVWCVIVPGAG